MSSEVEKGGLLRDPEVKGLRRQLAKEVEARKALEAHLRLLHMAVDESPNVVMVTDAEGTIEFVNRRFAEITGIPADQAVGSSATGLGSVDGGDPDEMWAALTRGEVWTGTFRNRTRAGREYWERVRIYPVPDETGEIRHYVKVARDVTDERDVRERARWLEAALEIAPVGIFAARQDSAVSGWRIVSANPGLGEIFGLPVADLLQCSLTELLGNATDLAASLTADGPFDGELLAPGCDGRETWVRAWLRPIPGEMEGRHHLVGAVADVSRLKESEAELERRVEERVAELRLQQDALRASQEQLLQAQKMEAMGRLAGGVAHDFNNVLSVILGYSELILDEIEEEDPMRDDLVEIGNAGERAAALTRQLLAFSRRQVLEPRPFSINDRILALQKMLGRLLRETIDLQLDLEPGIRSVYMDPGHLDQILMNLAVNASDAMPSGGRLTIRTRSAGDRVLLEVADNGLGMDAETKARAFDPFFTTKVRGEGTGLGLSTVHGIVEQSGGAIELDTAPGRGATFSLTLPFSDREPTEAAIRPVETSAGAASNVSVLLVEDEVSVLRLLRRYLEGFGCTVHLAHDGFEAERVWGVWGDEIGLVVTDLVLPGKSGMELARGFRGQRADLPIVFVSGYDEDLESEGGLLPELSAFLSKPLSRDRLLDTVRRLLATAEVLRAGRGRP